MTQSIGAQGILGIAFETVYGTYVVPAKYHPFLSETLTNPFEHVFRRPVRGVADVVGAKKGNSRVEGDITFEVQDDAMVYWLAAARGTIVKAGAGPYTYTFTPSHAGKGPVNKALSITIQRGDEAFGYVGCLVTALEFSHQDGILTCRASVIGKDEATQTDITGTFSAVDVFGPGEWNVEVPTATVRTDIDTFTLTVDDSGEAQHRLSNTRTPQFVKYGERSVALTLEADFDTRTEYDAFKALTAQEILVEADLDADQYVHLKVNSAIKESYEVNIGGQGDLVRASISYQGIYDTGDSKSYEIEVGSEANIVLT